MVRNYKKVKFHVRNGVTYPPYSHYGENSIMQAIEDIRNGRLNCNQASRRYNIPRSTLMRRIHQPEVVSLAVQRQLLKPDVEKMIVSVMNLVSDWHFPFTRLDLRYLAKAYLDSVGIQHTKVSDNLPGVDWSRLFLGRHNKELSRPLIHEKSYEGSSSVRIIKQFLENTQNILTGMDPRCILCFNETNLTNDLSGNEFVLKRNCRYYKHYTSTSKTAFCVIYTGNACGELLNPFFIYKGDQLWDSWKKGGPCKSRYSKSVNGWLESNSFENWFYHVIVDYCRTLPPDIRKVIICEYFSVHFTIPVLQKCRELNIFFLCFPPKSNSTMQPLHVAFYESFRKKWPKILKTWNKNNNYQTLPNDVFPRLIKQLHQELQNDNCDKTSLISAFNDTGLYPLNVSRVKSKLMKDKSNANFEKDFIDVYKSEPQIIKAESLFFRDDEDCFETDSINDADYFVETEAICIEKDPLEELDDDQSKLHDFLIEDIIWEKECSHNSNENSVSYSIEDVHIKEEIITVELSDDEEMVEEPSFQSININNENESTERVLDKTSIADFSTNDIDHSNQIELSIYPLNSV